METIKTSHNYGYNSKTTSTKITKVSIADLVVGVFIIVSVTASIIFSMG